MACQPLEYDLACFASYQYEGTVRLKLAGQRIASHSRGGFVRCGFTRCMGGDRLALEHFAASELLAWVSGKKSNRRDERYLLLCLLAQ